MYVFNTLKNIIGLYAALVLAKMILDDLVKHKIVTLSQYICIKRIFHSVMAAPRIGKV